MTKRIDFRPLQEDVAPKLHLVTGAPEVPSGDTPSFAADLDAVLDDCVAAFDFSIDVLKLRWPSWYHRSKRNELLEDLRTSYHRMADMARLK